MNLFSKIALSPITSGLFAHAGVAFFVMFLGSRAHSPLWICALSAILAAGIKEFYIDLRYEVAADGTRQTLWDSIEDFAGYAAGIALAAHLCAWRIVL